MINKATLMGRIGKKEYKPTRNGSFVCQLSIATSRKYIDSHGNTVDNTTWHNVNFFSKLADVANKYTQVGDLVYIEGEISNRKIDDNGVSRIIHSIIGNEIKFIPTGRKDNQQKSEDVNSSESHAVPTQYDEIDIPF